jgi:hypothetical protein
MDAVVSYEMFFPIYKTTQWHVQEDDILNVYKL